jgi:phosphoglycolate phosphatase
VRFPLIAFDLDGTLVDSLRDLAESANALLAHYGAAPLDEASIGRMVGGGAPTLVRRVLAAAAVDPHDNAVARYLAIYNSRLLKWTRPYPEIPELLAELSARRVPLAVLTNKPLEATRQILAGLQLARFFPADCVLGGDGPQPRKPDPAGLVALAAMHNAPLGKILLVGDSAVDWHTSRAAGSQICMARYGFGFHDFPVAELAEGDMSISQPLDLLTHL